MNQQTIVGLQQSAGNRGVQRLLAGGGNFVPVSRDTALDDPVIAEAAALAPGNLALQRFLQPLLRSFGRAAVQAFLVVFPTGAVSREVAPEIVGFIDSGGQPAAAQWAVTVFGSSPGDLRRLTWVLLDHPLADVQWAMGVAGNVVEDAASALAFVDRWSATDPAAAPLARAELQTVGVGAMVDADAAMIVLQKYNFDPTLRDWVKSRAQEMAEAKLSAEKGRFKAAREKAEEPIEQGVKQYRGKRPDKISARGKKDLKAADDKIAALKQAEALQGQEAETHVGEWAQEATAEMETWIADNSGVAGSLAAKWCLQKADKPGALPSAYLEFFRGADLPQGQRLVEWAIVIGGSNIDILKRLAGRVTKALGAGVPPETAMAAVAYAHARSMGDSVFNRLLSVLTPRPAEWKVLQGWLDSVKLSKEDAVDLLDVGLAAGMSTSGLSSLLAAEKRKLTEVKWAVRKAASPDAAVVEQHLELLRLAASTANAELVLDGGATAEEGVKLLARVDPNAPNPTKVRELLGGQGVTAALLLGWLDTSKVEVAELYRYLVTEGVKGATLTTVLGICSAASLKVLFPKGKLGIAGATGEASVNNIITALGKLGNDAAQLTKLMNENSGAVSATMVRIVDAHNSIGYWAGNSANVSTILYHYDKHVIDEGGGGGPAAKSVADYSADSAGPVARWNDPGNGVSNLGGWKIRGSPGGTYDQVTRKAFTFWYSSLT